MAQDTDAIANLRARAFMLARTGSYSSWAGIRDALISEGYLETFNPRLDGDDDFHRELAAACAQSGGVKE